MLAGGKLIDYDCPDSCTTPNAPEDKARNRKLHDTVAVLNLWIEDLDTSQINLAGVRAAINTGPLNSPNYFPVEVSIPGFKTKQSGMVKVYIPTANLYFPDACRTGNKSCLRDPDKANYELSEKDQKNVALDREDTFHNIQSVLNTITIKGLTVDGKTLNLSTSYLFLNGVRPVMLMSGIDFPSTLEDAIFYLLENETKDTTNDWGGLGIHPMNGDPSDRCKELGNKANKDATYNCKESNWIKWLSADAGIPTWNPYRNGTRSIKDQQTFLIEGAEFLNRVYGAKKINIIAHSMGGVTSRRFTYEGWNGTLDDTKRSPATTDKLITLDSPHTGVTAANLPIIGSMLGDAQNDLGTKGMETFNKDFDLQFGPLGNKIYKYSALELKKHIYFINAHAKENQLCVVNNGNMICVIVWLEDDGLIEDKSATGTAYAHDNPDNSHLPSRYATYPTPLPDICNHVKLYNGDFFCHGWVLGSTEIKDWVIKTAGVFDYCRNNLPNYATALYTACDPARLELFNKTTSAGSGDNRAYSMSSLKLYQSTAVASTVPSTTLMYNTGVIKANSTVTVPLIVDNVENLIIRVSTMDGQPIQVHLENAAKTQVLPDKPLPITYSFPGQFPAPGNYNLVLNSGAISGTVQYIVEVLANSSVGFDTQIFPTTAGSGKPGNVLATLLDTTNNSPITGATITATLKIQAGKTITTTNLILKDSGTDGDLAAGDGKYTALLPDGLTSEFIQVEVIVKGSYKGQAFTRFASDFTKARSGEIRFNGNYKWQNYSGSNTAATNGIDYSIFEAGVNVQRNGVYQIEATLVDANGLNVLTTSTSRTVEAGNTTLQIRFNGQQFVQGQYTGPFHISTLRAYVIEGDQSREADRVIDVKSIPELNLNVNQLNRPTLAIAGSFTDKTLDAGIIIGKYRNLEIRVPLDVAKTDTYSFSAELYSPSGKSLGTVQGQTKLEIGLGIPLILVFPGDKIGENKENGPYLLKGMTLSDSKDGKVLLYRDFVGQTNTYQYTDFISSITNNSADTSPKNDMTGLILIISIAVIAMLIIISFFIFIRIRRHH